MEDRGRRGDQSDTMGGRRGLLLQEEGGPHSGFPEAGEGEEGGPHSGKELSPADTSISARRPWSNLQPIELSDDNSALF